MRVAKIGDMKNNLSRHLEYVRRGGRVRILDRDTPVADLVPIESSSEGEDDALLLKLERQGLLHRGCGGPLPAELLRRGPGGPHTGAVEALLAERRSGR